MLYEYHLLEYERSGRILSVDSIGGASVRSSRLYRDQPWAPFLTPETRGIQVRSRPRTLGSWSWYRIEDNLAIDHCEVRSWASDVSYRTVVVVTHNRLLQHEDSERVEEHHLMFNSPPPFVRGYGENGNPIINLEQVWNYIGGNTVIWDEFWINLDEAAWEARRYEGNFTVPPGEFRVWFEDFDPIPDEPQEESSTIWNIGNIEFATEYGTEIRFSDLSDT